MEEKFEEELENNEESNEKLDQEEYEIPEKANYEEELIEIIRRAVISGVRFRMKQEIVWWKNAWRVLYLNIITQLCRTV